MAEAGGISGCDVGAPAPPPVVRVEKADVHAQMRGEVRGQLLSAGLGGPDVPAGQEGHGMRADDEIE